MLLHPLYPPGSRSPSGLPAPPPIHSLPSRAFLKTIGTPRGGGHLQPADSCLIRYYVTMKEGGGRLVDGGVGQETTAGCLSMQFPNLRRLDFPPPPLLCKLPFCDSPTHSPQCMRLARRQNMTCDGPKLGACAYAHMGCLGRMVGTKGADTKKQATGSYVPLARRSKA